LCLDQIWVCKLPLFLVFLPLEVNNFLVQRGNFVSVFLVFLFLLLVDLVSL
jgi:hypothetical protein